MARRILGMIVTAGVVAASAGQASAQKDLSRLRGDIKIDGSSTVYPITEAVAEEFGEAAPRVRVTVGISGTGGGFKRFIVGETDISDASRPIKDKEYKAAMDEGVGFIEIPVAYDGLTIVINKNNYWVDSLSVDELRKIFLDGTNVDRWNEVRSDWPDKPIQIFSPGTDSGTFDYFKEVVAEEEGSIRGDMSVSEDDNVLVRGVAGNEGAIGFFGAAYYFENKDKLKSVPIVNDELGKPVSPTPETIENGEYAPFSRPVFIYVSAKSADRREVEAFVNFYLENAARLSEEVGYVRLPQVIYDRASKNFQNRKTGTHFLDKDMEKVKGPLPSVYK
ncbi:MAG: PstS family phosphate ABC transporter substrate-binding protein [Phycisphaerales bacterium]